MLSEKHKELIVGSCLSAQSARVQSAFHTVIERTPHEISTLSMLDLVPTICLTLKRLSLSVFKVSMNDSKPKL